MDLAVVERHTASDLAKRRFVKIFKVIRIGRIGGFEGLLVGLHSSLLLDRVGRTLRRVDDRRKCRKSSGPVSRRETAQISLTGGCLPSGEVANFGSWTSCDDRDLPQTEQDLRSGRTGGERSTHNRHLGPSKATSQKLGTRHAASALPSRKLNPKLTWSVLRAHRGGSIAPVYS